MMATKPNASGAAIWSAFWAVLALLVTAEVWYVILVVAGVSAVSIGVAMQFGLGFGLIALGVLCICGSEMVRQGMMRA